MATAGRHARIGIDGTMLPDKGLSGLTVDMAEGTREVAGGGIGASELTGHTEGTLSFTAEYNDTVADELWVGPGLRADIEHYIRGTNSGQTHDVYDCFLGISITANSGEAVTFNVSGDIMAEPTTENN